MRVTLVNLTSGGLSGGYKKYLETMLPLLGSDPGVSSLEVCSPFGLDYRRPASMSEWCWPENDGRSGFAALKAHVRDREPDVVFIPTARLVATGLPTVAMVRNMEPLVAPFTGNSLRDGLRNLARRYSAHAAARKADRVIAVSGFVRDFLVDRWGIPADRIGLVPHGIEAPLDETRRAAPASLRAAPMSGVILFTAGSIRPARGLEDAIEALALLTRHGTSARLIIAGQVAGDAERYRQSLDRHIRRSGLSGRVCRAGSLTPSEMGWCFARCDAFIMTSRVEACPNTALEAMTYGAVCVSTTNRPMPETFESAALYYPAGDAAALTERLEAVIEGTPANRRALSSRAIARAADFMWARTARDTVRQLALAAAH